MIMGMRTYKRAVAKGILAAAGVGNINQKFSKRSSEGIPLWKVALAEGIKKKTSPRRIRKVVKENV